MGMCPCLCVACVSLLLPLYSRAVTFVSK
uniref:Uncharacterized protein n=1 Tax=Anguilla anguilla TaxID=7936 RepID=A0A0E9Q754_ANGAN